MKDKILFWIEDIYTHFGLAKLLQENYNYDLFAIFDVYKKPKKFFESQNMVSFKKKWFYLDEIHQTNKEPDMEYLKKIEEKYKINLWSIIHSERYFLHYNRYHKFTTNEILSLVEQECRFFEKVIEESNPKFLFIYMTAWHHQEILFQICQAKNIKILMTAPIRFGYKSVITHKATELIDNIEYNNIKNEEILFNPNKTLKGFSDFKEIAYKQNSILTKFFKVMKFIMTTQNKDYTKHFRNKGKTPLKIIIKEVSKILKGRYRKYFLDRNSLKEISNKKDFVYFPLMSEPERTSLMDAPYYANQIEVIKNIVKSLPIEYELWVKEHPIMSIEGWRPISYWKEINNIRNVKFIHPSVSSDKLIKKCSLVITIGGTVSLEAIFQNKPSITFVETEFSVLPSVHKLKNLEELPTAIKLSLRKKIDMLDLNKYMYMLNKNSFNFDLNALSFGFRDKFQDQTGLMDVNISAQNMKEYLQENKNEFKILMEKHIEKMEKRN
jgi:hypothetical protein